MHGGRWLDELWARVDGLDRAIYADRVAGWTLLQIGDQHGISRERARQLLVRVGAELVAAADMLCPDWRARVATFASEPAVSTDVLATILDSSEPVAVSVLVGAAGFVRPRAWGRTIVPGWWTAIPGALETALREIVSVAPLRGEELDRLPVVERLPRNLPLAALLRASHSPLTQGVDGSWLRRAARGRDSVYLWMLEQGVPCRVEDLASALGNSSPAALREALRRDDRFTQIRPEGTWVLTEWSHDYVNPYSNAEQAMVAVLEEEGAMSKECLFARVVERYPVTTRRLQQCLSSDRIGVTPSGFLDLIARGAEPIQEPEPTRPETMAVDQTGKVFGVRLTVDDDILRGSGIVIHTWLTWKLGLHRAPMSKTFTVDESSVLTIRRRTSGAQISSLRKYIHVFGAVHGCQIAVLLRADDFTARILHTCPAGACPGRKSYCE